MEPYMVIYLGREYKGLFSAGDIYQRSQIIVSNSTMPIKVLTYYIYNNFT
jgi:hypothetical protein